MTHQEIEHQEIFERYVRDKLSAADRTAFQEHFFACDDCFDEVQRTEQFIAGVNHAARTGRLQAAQADAPLPFLQWARSLTGRTGAGDWRGISIVKPALAFMLMVVLIAGAILYFRSRDRAPKQTLAKDNTPTILQPGNHVTAQPSDHGALQAGTNQNKEGAASQQTRTSKPLLAQAPGKATKGQRPSALSNTTANESNQNQSGVAESEATRSVNSSSEGAKLSEVKRVFVEAIGDHSANGEVRRLLIRQLRSSNRFNVAQSKDDADAVLKFSAMPGREKSIIVRLVNANGFVIWPVESTGSGRKYTGRTDESATRVVNDLLLETRRTDSKD